MKKSILYLLMLSMLLGTSVFADEESHVKTAKKLLEVSNARNTLDQLISVFDNLMSQQFNSLDLPPEGIKEAESDQSELKEWFNEFFKWEQIESIYVEVYVEVFSEYEMKKLIEFYKTRVGKKLLEKMPTLIQKSMEKTQELMKEKMPEFQKRLINKTTALQEKYKDA